MAVKDDGRDKEAPKDAVPPVIDETRPDVTEAPPAAAKRAEDSFNILTEDEAERKGDYTALARIKLANRARELSERFDVDGDGKAPKEDDGKKHRRDRYGGYYKGGRYHDKFGGYYDKYGYSSKDGDYTSYSGAHYDHKTNTITMPSGKQRDIPEDLKNNPDAVRAIAQTEPQVEEYIANNPAVAVIDPTDEQTPGTGEGGRQPSLSGNGGIPPGGTAAAGERPGGGGGRGRGRDSSAQTMGVTDILVRNRVAAGMKGEELEKPYTHSEYKAAFAEYDKEHERKQAWFKTKQNALAETVLRNEVPGGPGAETPGGAATNSGRRINFTAVSKEDATAKVRHVYIPTASKTAASKVENKSKEVKEPAGDGTTPEETKTDTAASGTWYQDRGGYWDEWGGYYDKDGGYWEADGGYWDRFGVYTDVKGGRTWPDKSYLDPNFNYVDKDGCYIMDDGTKIKPPAGMDFKKQMQEAALQDKKWELPEELKPLIASKVPAVDLNLKATTPLVSVDPKAGAAPKTDPADVVLAPINVSAVKIEPVKISTNLDITPVKLDTTFGSPKTTSTSFLFNSPKAGDSSSNVDMSRFQMCTAPSTTKDPKNDFSSFFNNYHSFVTSTQPASETKFYDLSNITLSPSVDAKPQLAVLETPADKSILLPKTYLA